MIKVECKSPELLEETLRRIINVAAVVASSGNLPTDYDQRNPALGRVPLWTSDKTCDLYPVVNDYKMHIQERGENYATVWFQYRYDRPAISLIASLEKLLAARFSENVTVIE